MRIEYGKDESLLFYVPEVPGEDDFRTGSDATSRYHRVEYVEMRVLTGM
jgi:hypothetical protein